MRLSLFAALDGWFAPATGRAGWLSGVTFAHRGLHGDSVPENSLAACLAAAARGLGIECDVQLTADGQAAVFHDFTLDRLTAERGPVIARSAADVSAIMLTGSREPIPALSTLLGAVAGRVPLLIELKSRRNWPIATLCAAVKLALGGYRGDLGVMSFDPRVGAWFARHAPNTVRGLIITEEGARRRRHTARRHLSLWQAQPDFLAYDIRDLPSRFAAAQRARGLPVASWTVRSPELLARARSHADAPIAEGAGIA
jgi:glycerophosphoryl diester phosphodiesterase